MLQVEMFIKHNIVFGPVKPRLRTLGPLQRPEGTSPRRNPEARIPPSEAVSIEFPATILMKFIMLTITVTN